MLPRYLTASLVLFVLLPGKAAAHVKWFVDADVAASPRAVGAVLTRPLFVYLLLGSIAAIYGFFLLDRWMLRRRVLAEWDERMRHFDVFSIHVMRISAMTFFLSLSAWYWTHGAGFYLTPDCVPPRSGSPGCNWPSVFQPCGAEQPC